MDPATATLISTAAQSGGNILTAWMNHKWQSEQLAQNEAWAREDATTAYNRQIDFWNRQNAYNTPAAQMQRYLDAGLNPNIIASGMIGSSGAIGAPAVPQAHSASGNASQIAPGMFDSIMQNRYLQAQIERLDNQNQNDSLMTSGQLARWAVENHLSYAEASRIQTDVRRMNKEISKLDAEIRVLGEEERIKRVEAVISEETMKGRINQLMDEFKLTHDQAETFVKVQNSIIAANYGSAHQAEATAKQISQLTPKELALRDAMNRYYDNSANKLSSEQDLLDLQYVMEDLYGSEVRNSQIIYNYMSANKYGLGLLGAGLSATPEQIKTRKMKRQKHLEDQARKRGDYRYIENP